MSAAKPLVNDLFASTVGQTIAMHFTLVSINLKSLFSTLEFVLNVAALVVAKTPNYSSISVYADHSSLAINFWLH